MPPPVINITSSVLGYLQHETFAFQPAALNSPTHWLSSALPPGLSLNATTGLISGAVTLPGVYVVNVFAENAAGISAPVPFTFGIESSLANAGDNVIDLTVDLATRQVFGFFTAKYDDDIMFRVQFLKGGVSNSIALSGLKVALKEIDGDPCLVTSSAFSSLGSGVFLVYLKLASSALKGALDYYETDIRTVLPGLWELEWLAPTTFSIGPATLRGTSQTFLGDVVRDLINP